MKEKNKKVIILLVMVLLLVGIVIGVTYAAFTFSKIGTTENTVTTGAVTMTYTEGDNGITINNAMPMSDEVGKKLNEENQIFDFTININIIGKMGISYEVTAEKDRTSTLANNEVRLYLEKSLDRSNYEAVLEPSYYTPIDAKDDFGAKAGEMILDNGTTSETVTYYYRLRMWVDENYELSEVAKKFTVRVNAYGKDGTYTENDPKPKNANIKAIYTYNQESGADNYCVTGEEATCKKSTCFQDESVGSCPAGTIIKYQVNDTDIVNFHVMSDNGSTMMMQSQRNIINNIAWCSKEDYIAAGGTEADYGEYGNNNKGPLTILPALENATSSWSNVNDQTYSLNINTGCKEYNSSAICTSNRYTLGSRTAKARLITMQEVENLGCKRYNKSCPIWIYNYLNDSTSYEGTENDFSAGSGYWSSSAELNYLSSAWNVSCYGAEYSNRVSGVFYGTRAVVEVSK